MSMRFIMRASAGAWLLGLAFALCAKSPSQAASTADSTFMKHAAADGMAEIHMGKMALEKSSNPQVKQLAQRIVADHTDAGAKLQTLAQGKQVTLPAAPAADAQASAATMQGMDAAKFDQAWAAAMVSDHQKAVALFTDEIGQTRDPQVHAFAEATLPVLKTHLEMAQKLQGSLK